jgi:hypothetical protein
MTFVTGEGATSYVEAAPGINSKEIAMNDLILPAEPVRLTYECFTKRAASGLEFVVKALITPEVAAMILENNNVRNRKPRRSNVRFLAEQASSGRMIYNAEAIVIGIDGNVNNGQHRLMAAVKSNTAIVVLLVFGVPVEAFVTYDTGSVRGGADVLSIEGKANAERLAAALRHVDNFVKGRMGAEAPAGGLRKDNAYVIELAAKYPGLEESVARCTSFPSRITRPSLAAGLHYLFSQKDAAAANSFVDIVLHGLRVGELYDHNMAENAVQLREWLMKNNDMQRRPTPTVVANVWIKAWNSYRGRSVRKLLNFKSTEKQVEIV